MRSLDISISIHPHISILGLSSPIFRSVITRFLIASPDCRYWRTYLLHQLSVSPGYVGANILYSYPDQNLFKDSKLIRTSPLSAERSTDVSFDDGTPTGELPSDVPLGYE